MRFLLLIAGLMSGMWVSADTVRLGTFHIPLLSESSDKGVFVDLARAVAAEAGLEVQIVLLPAQRTREAFAGGRLDGLFPALAVAMETDYSATASFTDKRIYAFTRMDEPLITDAEQLSGKRVGYTEGFTYSSRLLNVSGARYQSTITDPQNIRKLVAGRIDVFLGDEVSALAAARQQGVTDRIHHDSGHPMAQYPVFFAFHNDERGRQLTQQFNQAIKALQDSGELQRILQVQQP